jgi:tetratricopeptide (TPR) repeat protein
MSYSVREVAAMLGLAPAQIRAWARDGLLSPQKGTRGALRLDFHDLVLLRTASELSAAHVPQRRIRKALENVREHLPEGRSITGLRISAHGEQIVVRDGESVWNPESGQSLFDFAISDVAAIAEPVARANFERARADDEGLGADDWYDLGCDLELRAPESAEEAYRRALTLDPSYADAHVNLGRIQHEGGATALAAQHYRAALAADPSHALAAFNLGVALEDLGKVDEAIAAYEHALELEPDNADAHYNLAGIHERRGDRAIAFQHLKEYSRLRA